MLSKNTNVIKVIEHIEQRDENGIFPKNLYHYTSLDNFVKIVKSKQIFLFSSYHMNDYKENQVLIKRLKEYISENRSLFSEKQIENLNETINKNFFLSIPYVFSLSEDNDSLSQWRAYGDDGNGICIGFNVYEMELSYRLPFSGVKREQNISIHNVIYDGIEQNKIIDGIIKIAKSNSLKAKKGYEEAAFAENALSLLVRFSPIYKLFEFKEENEWRILYAPTPLSSPKGEFTTLDRNSEIDFMNTRNNIKSYFKLNFTEEKFGEIVNTIILGPKSKITEYEMRAFLDTNNMNNTSFIRSKISYR